jgi:hypothetical protein
LCFKKRREGMKRLKVKTKMGEIYCPVPGPRAKYWAGALQDILRLEELYGVVAAALEEAYNAGRMAGIMSTFEVPEIIDVEGEVISDKRGDVEADREELDQQIQLAEAEGMGQSTREISENREALAQGDGDPGGTS